MDEGGNNYKLNISIINQHSSITKYLTNIITTFKSNINQIKKQPLRHKLK